MPDDPEAQRYVKAVQVLKVDGLYSGDRIGVTVNSDATLVLAVVTGVVGGLFYVAASPVLVPLALFRLLRKGVRFVFGGAR